MEEAMDLPPGFRFHPTDEELITHYLARKVADARFAARAIGEADLNKCEPWDLPSRAKMGAKEWYFFCLKDRKYPTGLRTNRATAAGYWKATGKDREVRRGRGCVVGMKKTLVFYTGRAPRGEKSSWVMHEYRLEGSTPSPSPSYSHLIPKQASKNEWVICRVFKKTSGAAAGAGKKQCAAMAGAARAPSSMAAAAADELASTLLPPLMDISAAAAAAAVEQAHVTCFSNAPEASHQFWHHGHAAPPFLSSPPMAGAALGGMQYAQGPGGGASLVQLLEGGGGYGAALLSQAACKGERERLSASQDTGLTSDLNPEISSSAASLHHHIDHDALWSY